MRPRSARACGWWTWAAARAASPGNWRGRVGADNVAAIDPAPQFVAACRNRNPGADVREGVAEQLPWPDDRFDASLSSLVIAFMRDPDRGIGEMARVTRPGGTVAACMWDIAGGAMTMLRIFWTAARQVDPGVEGERRRPGTSEGDIVSRLQLAGLQDVVGKTLEARADYADFGISGSRSRSSSGRRASTWPRWPTSSVRRCVRRVARSCPTGRSRWTPGPGARSGSSPRVRRAAISALVGQQRDPVDDDRRSHR